MLDAAIRRNLPLPKGWPARVRSSTVQAISLAHFSLTFARGVAATSSNRRVKRRGPLHERERCVRRAYRDPADVHLGLDLPQFDAPINVSTLLLVPILARENR